MLFRSLAGCAEKEQRSAGGRALITARRRRDSHSRRVSRPARRNFMLGSLTLGSRQPHRWRTRRPGQPSTAVAVPAATRRAKELPLVLRRLSGGATMRYASAVCGPFLRAPATRSLVASMPTALGHSRTDCLAIARALGSTGALPVVIDAAPLTSTIKRGSCVIRIARSVRSK